MKVEWIGYRMQGDKTCDTESSGIQERRHAACSTRPLGFPRKKKLVDLVLNRLDCGWLAGCFRGAGWQSGSRPALCHPGERSADWLAGERRVQAELRGGGSWLGTSSPRWAWGWPGVGWTYRFACERNANTRDCLSAGLSICGTVNPRGCGLRPDWYREHAYRFGWCERLGVPVVPGRCGCRFRRRGVAWRTSVGRCGNPRVSESWRERWLV